MRIRSHLASLVAAVALPTILLAAVALWHLRSVYWTAEGQRLEERVAAVAVAIDDELDDGLRALQQLAGAIDLAPSAATALGEAGPKLFALHPMWSSLSLQLSGDASGRSLVPTVEADLAPADAAFVTRLGTTRKAAVSDLMTGENKRPAVYIGVPLLRDNEVRGVVLAGMSHSRWLGLLQRYGVAAPETLTLNDSRGLIIARTLAHEQWVGKRSGAAFWDHTREAPRGSFASLSIDGKEFFSAFTHLRASGWVAGGGGPRAAINGQLAKATGLTVGLLIAATLGALLLAAMISDRIAGAITGLLETVSGIGSPDAPPKAPLAAAGSIDEIEAVRRKAEEADAQLREKAQAQTQALERATSAREDAEAENRSKDEFIAMLSHELRNPLAPISNALHLLRLQENETPLQQKARVIIERQVGQLNRLVGELLEISRITTGRIQLIQERIVVSGIVERAVETAQSLITQHRHELTVTMPQQPVWLYADAGRLEQVLVNLLTNAAKYTEDGGRIWLSLEQEGDTAVLRIRDNGIGIDPILLPRIFDLFTQATRSLDRSQGGLGIGLCLVQRLVELHGGTVNASSVVGQGSEFAIRLPVMTLAASASPLPASIAVQPLENFCRVLVVDDNVDAAQSLAMLLEMSGHEIRMAYDGPSALEAARAYRPDMMLLDIGLPGLTGLQVAQQIRREPTLEPIVLVAVTGYGQEADRQRSREAGFDHHLAKPLDFEQLQKILATVALETRIQ